MVYNLMLQYTKMLEEIVVGLLDIQTDKIEIGLPKEYNDKTLYPITYEGKKLLVRYPKMNCCFGITEKYLIDKKYLNDRNIYGYKIRFSYDKNYNDSLLNPCFQKVKELDEFFINVLYNSPLTPKKNEYYFSGEDMYGTNGKWIRLNNYHYLFDKINNRKIYMEKYSVGIETNIKSMLYLNTRDKLLSKIGKFNMILYDEGNNTIENMTTENYQFFIPKFSDLSCLVEWSNICCSKGFYSLSSHVTQMKIHAKNNNKECML